MPRKKRDIRRDLRKAGFVETKGKGDHTKFRHSLITRHVVGSLDMWLSMGPTEQMQNPMMRSTCARRYVN
jgi:predicted RNA binding protein YcfA (HicA-like mRNA interferase family)